MSNDPAEVWCILTMKENNVSLLKNLSAAEARSVMQRLCGGDPWSQETIYAQVLAQLGRDGGASHYISFGPSGGHGGWGVERCEVWGSKGGALEVWPKPDDYDARMAEALKVAGIVTATNNAIDKNKAAA